MKTAARLKTLRKANACWQVADSARLGTAGRPIQKLYRMHDRHVYPGGDLSNASDVAGCNDIGSRTFDIAHLAVAELPRNHRLQQVVGPGGAAADMGFRYIHNQKAGRG